MGESVNPQLASLQSRHTSVYHGWEKGKNG